MSDLKYKIKYGYLPISPLRGERYREWWREEDYEITEKEKATIAFEYFKRNRPQHFTNVDGDIPANILYFRLVHKETNDVISTFERYYYDGNERNLWRYGDRLHKEGTHTMSSLLYYGIRYGYKPHTHETQKWEWWKYENYQTNEKESALLAFDYFKHNRPSSFIERVNANVLALELLQKATNNVVSTLDTYYYEENQRSHEQNTFEDRPHLDLNPSQTRAVGPLSKGAYVVYVEIIETSERAVIGVALTPDGVNTLTRAETSAMDMTRKVIIEYHSFVEAK